MNELNYASLEASKRLVDAGIVLETEEVWYQGENGTWYLSDVPLPTHSIPAPSMAEVWRELPEQYDDEYLQVFKDENETRCGYGQYADRWHNANPTDALIDLLIWVRKESENDLFSS